jgi:hypothetical protein
MPLDTADLRSLLRDDEEAYFSDEELQAAIDASGDSIYRAAGLAIQTLAVQMVLEGESIRTDDLAIDTRGRGNDLLAVAKSFFKEAATSEADEGFEIVSFGGRKAKRVCRVEGSPYPCCGACS